MSCVTGDWLKHIGQVQFTKMIIIIKVLIMVQNLVRQDYPKRTHTHIQAHTSKHTHTHPSTQTPAHMTKLYTITTLT